MQCDAEEQAFVARWAAALRAGSAVRAGAEARPGSDGVPPISFTLGGESSASVFRRSVRSLQEDPPYAGRMRCRVCTRDPGMAGCHRMYHSEDQLYLPETPMVRIHRRSRPEFSELPLVFSCLYAVFFIGVLILTIIHVVG